MNWKRFMLGSALLVTFACGDEETKGPLDGDGDGGANDGGNDPDGGTRGDGGGGNGGNGDGGPIVIGDGGGNVDCDGLKATIRDFKDTHPDFQAFTGTGPTLGLVAPNLGTDNKPVYTGICEKGKTLPAMTCKYGAQTSGAASFAQWYTDVVDVNQAFPITLSLTKNGNEFVSENPVFFPIDGRGFGNSGNDAQDPPQAHNFHFTTEVHTSFTYVGGQKFTFRGDDDLWIFVNGKLALDLGGLHQVQEETIDFDAQAASLGITVGGTYNMDIFHAERRTSASNFRIATNIQCFLDPVI